MIKRYSHFCAGLLMLLGGGIVNADNTSSATQASSVTSGSITFNFDKNYSTGQFLDGQWWVHNDGQEVVITSITPDSYDDNGRIRNGAELNPLNESTQGFDGLGETGVKVDMPYAANKNVDPGATGQSLALLPGNSLVKAISRTENDNRPLIDQVAILTVLDKTPADNSFRPAYVGNDKTIIATLDDLNFDALGKFEPLENTPDISQYVPYIEGVWLDHNTEWTQREIHPESSMPVYGREIGKLTSVIGMQLQLNYTDAEKQDALIGMVQYAIDLYGVLNNAPINGKEGYYWYNNGGHNQGRKLPLLIAGKVLNHSGMLEKVRDNRLFQEDQQTFYVSQAEIDLSEANVRDGYTAYTTEDLGVAEWGIRPWDRTNVLNADWGSRYRTITGNVYTVTSLAVRLMGATEEWNWPAFFDYADRYFAIEGTNVNDGLSGNSIHTSAADLWNAYHSQLVSEVIEPVIVDSTSNSATSGDITFHFAENYPMGQFLDGQWWVHNYGGDVVVNSITPDSYNDEGRVRNGAELNPLNESTQGFDGLGDTGVGVDMPYMADKNVDPGITGEALVLSPGTSLVKAISREENASRPLLSQAAILTVLDHSPADNSFRPAYVGNDKTIPATLDDLNFNVLGKYEPLDSTPHISDYVPYIEGVWLDHNTEWTQREIHPESSMPMYGRELGKVTSIIGMQLQLNYTDAEKQDALIGMVQYAIDLYGVLKNDPINGNEGYYWYNNGGHNQGRKLPLLIAGKVLNHSGMLEKVNDNRLFQEDHQTFYVSQREIDISEANARDGYTAYTTEDLGLAEWGIRPWDRTDVLNADWGSKYRSVIGNVSAVTSLAVRLMGTTEEWNWPAFFDYSDRYFSIEGEHTSKSLKGNNIHVSAAELWNVYRDQLGENNFK